MEVHLYLTLKKLNPQAFSPELFYSLYQTIKIGKNNHIGVQLRLTCEFSFKLWTCSIKLHTNGHSCMQLVA